MSSPIFLSPAKLYQALHLLLSQIHNISLIITDKYIHTYTCFCVYICLYAHMEEGMPQGPIIK